MQFRRLLCKSLFYFIIHSTAIIIALFPIILVADALNWLVVFRKEIQSLRDREALLQSQLTVFGINYPDSRELAELEKVKCDTSAHILSTRECPRLFLFDFPSFFHSAKDMAAIELVWQLTDEWNDAWERYKTGNFWTIEIEEMDTTANLLLRKLTKLSRELKEKNWEIVENTRCDPVVIQFPRVYMRAVNMCRPRAASIFRARIAK